MREAGLTAPTEHEPEHVHTGFRPFAASGITGLARPQEWQVTTTAIAPDVRGDEVSFDVLPDRTVLVEEEEGDTALAPLADAVEAELSPPYRARGVRQNSELWAVAARAIEVVHLPGGAGDAIEVTVRDGERTVIVDGEQVFGSIPVLEELGSSRSFDYALRAERLDGDWWEVRIDAL